MSDLMDFDSTEGERHILRNLRIDEISGVDRAASGAVGWCVLKSAGEGVGHPFKPGGRGLGGPCARCGRALTMHESTSPPSPQPELIPSLEKAAMTDSQDPTTTAVDALAAELVAKGIASPKARILAARSAFDLAAQRLAEAGRQEELAKANAPKPVTPEQATLAETIRKARVNRNLSQTDVAEACGVTARQVVNWESGASAPSRDPQRLAATLGYDVDGQRQFIDQVAAAVRSARRA